MKILHIVPGLNEGGNGIAVAAKLIAAEQGAEIVDARKAGEILTQRHGDTEGWDEVWVHSMWLPMTLKACWKVLRLKKENLHSTTTNFDSSPRLVRMTHANLDPVRLGYHGWKKRLVAPIERWLFKRTDRVVVTCEAEKKWCQEWGLRNEFEVVDLKRFFNLGVDGSRSRTKDGSLHVLYLGRRHPLKGVEFLERAIKEIEQSNNPNNRTIDFRIVSDHFGEELEKDWAWCDVLVLPTLSENFGLVVAEALEGGKRVITTDGAPVWEGQPGVVYLKGYRDGTDEKRVELLKDAIRGLV